MKTYDAYAGVEYPAMVPLGDTFNVLTWIRWQHPQGLPETGSVKVNVSQVRVTPLMKVTMSADSSALVIESQSTAIQHIPLEATGSTEWSFHFRAIKPGTHKVTAHFSYVTAEGGVVALAETYDQTRTIEVQVLSWKGRMSARRVLEQPRERTIPT
jgi:hypothetical protein